MIWRRLIWLWILALPGLVAVAAPVADSELAQAPTRERLDALGASARTAGWGPWVGPLRDASMRAYAREPASAAPWHYLHRWAALFATPRAKAVSSWIEATKRLGAGHAGMPARYELLPGSLAAEVPPALQRWLIGDVTFSREFFSMVGERDQPVEVLRVLAKLHQANSVAFTEYASLALAIAIVMDVPPPPDWPHGQVGSRQLPRRLPDAVAAFAHWVQLDRRNVTAVRLRSLGAAELKFVVDASAPLAELSWAQRNVTPPISELARAYDLVTYRKDRLAEGRFMWPGADYKLETILREGGICVDQAYFAANVGKARGVPTLLFRGAGMDGRHAWFGFLAPSGWMMDAGRHAEQRYVTGFARDPQTWCDLSDHEILFLSERFTRTPLYHFATLHADFAAEFLLMGDLHAARQAAREAVSRESKHVRGWRLLIAASGPGAEGMRRREDAQREAMLALRRYPDLERAFGMDWISSLRLRGEKSMADAEERRLLQKYRGNRDDLSVQQVSAILERSLQEDDLATQVRTYQQLVGSYGRGAGVDFFDRVVVPFVNHMRARGETRIAKDAVERARRVLRVESGGQLDSELQRLTELLAPKR